MVSVCASLAANNPNSTHPARKTPYPLRVGSDKRLLDVVYFLAMKLGVTMEGQGDMSETQASRNEDGLTRAEYMRLFIASALSMMMTLVFNGTLYLAYDGIFNWSRDLSTAVSIALAIACLVIARKRPALIRPRMLTVCTIGLSVAGYALCAVGVVLGSAPAIVAGVVAVAPIDLWGIVLWLLSLARLPRRQACLSMALSGLAGIVLAFAINEWAPYGLVNLIAAVSSVAVVVLCRPLTQGFFERLPLVEPTSSQQVAQPEAVLPLSHAFYVYIFVFSVAYGFALRCENYAGPLTVSIASLASSGAVALYAWKAKAATKVDSLFVAAFFSVAVGFMFVLTGDARTGQLASTLLMMGYMCLQLLIWLALSAAAQRNTAEAIPTICWGNAISYAGITVGVTLWLVPNSFLAPLLAGDKLLQNALVIAVLAGLVLYTLLTRRSFVFDAAIEGIAPDVAAPQVEVQYVDSLASRCEQAVARYALTAREADVMTLLAHGNTATRIQEELGISYNTVKYHVKNVYAKMGVHSQQELIDLLCEKEVG